MDWWGNQRRAIGERNCTHAQNVYPTARAKQDYGGVSGRKRMCHDCARQALTSRGSSSNTSETSAAIWQPAAKMLGRMACKGCGQQL
eukprot:scaffold109683_cov35-Prasinocladus_malaysianus.AAC.1